MQKVYIVEDDENIRGIVLYALQSAGFEAMGFETGAAFFAASETAPPDLALLDIMLPGDDGLSILRRLRGDRRSAALPVIMLTAKGSEFDKVKGLDMGADDYIAKPFGVMELISRIRAVLRRAGAADSREAQEPQLSLGGLLIDDDRREVHFGGKRVILTYKEYELLSYLARNAGLALSRERIMEAVWGNSFEGESRTLDMHIRALRQKLHMAGLAHAEKALIHTVRGVGYKLGE